MLVHISVKKQIEEVWSPTLSVSKQHLADSISVISNITFLMAYFKPVIHLQK